MLKKISLLVLSLAPHLFYAESNDSTSYLSEVEVVTNLKERKFVEELPLSANTFSMTQIENINSSSTKDLTSFVPNFHLPEYGSQMTSSIYVRGFGTRIDQPVVGMIVDNIPVLNKNAFDADLFDLQRAEFLRGPQGTLYGRNTMCGLINIYTLSPFSYQGTRLNLDYSTANTFKIKASTYQNPSQKFAYSIAANMHHTNGYFYNQYNDDLCDPSNSITLRNRLMWRPKASLSIENTISANLLRQGGYAYGLIIDGNTQPINYNDECHYNRLTLQEGIVMKKKLKKMDLSSVTSYQFLNDEMLLDNDFLPQSIFTLNQAQKEHVITEEVILLSNTQNKIWSWKSGLYGFYKYNCMSAPVTFKEDGINQLILSNANKGIQSAFPEDRLDIAEKQFAVNSDFTIPTFGIAAYHQSEFNVGKWMFTTGLRIDYEKDRMSYTNETDIHYIFTLLMKDYKSLSCTMDGETEQAYFEVLPKFSIQYNINDHNHLYAYAAKGYKAGGFNTQIFSDILQNKLKNDIMHDLGMRFDGMGNESYNTDEAISYKPEYNWTYEIGGHFSWLDKQFTTNMSLFYIDCRNQQLTVFPKGKNTGRMMTNAGKSKSLGSEISILYSHKNLLLNGTYGYTHASFTEFDDGNHSYNGNYIPYSPLNTASIQAQYTFYINKKIVDKLIVIADWKGTGKIYWDEANSVEQSFYSLFGSSIIVQKDKFQLKGWCKNIGGADYNTFYFVSMGNSFCQKGKPRQIGVSIKYEF
jgi:outer membrane receptor protein involved in Fe transport